MLNRIVVDTVSKTFTAEVVFTVKVNRKLSLILIPELQLRYKSHFYSAVDWQTQKLKGQLRSSLASMFYFFPESSFTFVLNYNRPLSRGSYFVSGDLKALFMQG